MLVNPSFWIVVGACIVGCYIAAIHAALRTFNRSLLTEKLEAGRQLKALPLITEQTEELILITGTIRTALNMAIVLSVLGMVDHYLDDYLNVKWEVLKYLVAFLIGGVLITFFAVVVPGSLARHVPEALLARSTFTLGFIRKLFHPVIKPLQAVDTLVRRMTGVDISQKPDTAASEVMSVVEEHEGTQVDPAQKQMIEAVFSLPVTTAGEIMTPRTEIQALPAGASVHDLRVAILKDGHSRIPIYEGTIDNITGVLLAKDLIQFLGTDKPIEIRQVLREAIMVPKSKSVRELLAEFKARKVHMAIVLDEYGGTAGLVTIEDVIEELVGEIQDEYESTPDSPKLEWIDDRTAEVDARMHIDDIADELGLAVPEDADYDTVGGFVFATLGHIPEVGEQFTVEALRFTVTDAQRTKVKRVRVEKLEREEVEREAEKEEKNVGA